MSRHITKKAAQKQADRLNKERLVFRSSGKDRFDYVVRPNGRFLFRWKVISR